MYPEGSRFADRMELYRSGVHPHTQAGISGSATVGADSIVLNGGYKYDEDHGTLIVYSGHGPRNERGAPTADQQLTTWNLALARSCEEGLPVRVTRGYELHSDLAPPSGYRYDGIYRVERYWPHVGEEGFRVYLYQLVKETAIAAAEQRAASDGSEGPARRIEVSTNRIVRDLVIAARVKRMYGFRCQVCDETVETRIGAHAEAAHIRPLGRPHDGPDVESNLLCLCPNDHKRFDGGAIYITETPGRTFEVRLRLSGRVIRSLTAYTRHRINSDHLAYHRKEICGLTIG